MARRPHFEISASVVRQLGDELVSDEVTAIVELVKNAYDADADFAHVEVNTAAHPTLAGTTFPGARGFITIEDDGMGMSEDDINNGWLVISLSKKREMKAKGETTPKGRTPLGDKGLGRLSTQKLGDNLEIVTRKDGQDKTTHVAFSWKEFTDDKGLSAVPIQLSEAKSPRRKGSILAISDLRNPDVWKGASEDKLVTDLSQIISPFEAARPFLVTLKIDGKERDLGHVSGQVRNAAVGKFTLDYRDGVLEVRGKIRLAKFRGNQKGEDLEFFENNVVASNGKDFFNFLLGQKPVVEFSYSSDPAYFVEFVHRVNFSSLGGVESLKNDDGQPIGLADPGPFSGEIDEFLLRKDETSLRLSGLSEHSIIADTVQAHVGVKIFRDGFGIRPYGVNGEDWLRLGAQQTSGGSWYGMRPQNVIGYIKISEKENGRLKEKTDREGFVSDPYSRNFTRLALQASGTIETFYEWIRRSYNAYRLARVRLDTPLESGKEIVRKASSLAQQVSAYAQTAEAVERAAATAKTKVHNVSLKIEETPLLTSDAERELAALLAEARDALSSSTELFAQLQVYAAQGRELANMVRTVAPRLDILNDQLSDFSELAGVGMLAESLSHEVENQTDRLMQRASSASDKARKSAPPNVDLVLFAQEITSIALAMRRQIGHLTPSLRFRRDKLEPFRVSSLLADTQTYFSERWTGGGASIHLDIADDFPVRTNRGRLTQVIDNLFLNSEYWLRQSEPDAAGPGVFVECQAPFMRIWDNGIGVDPSVEASLFQPFISLKPKGEGRGLGLFISGQILQSMGCGIALLHERNQHGRRYKFELDLSGIVDGK
ncbi:ATP-binding protein [Rhizobium etli]|uniref:ATP-binding protein n=1 Tax=Rhizobium etli TaxID=29449 RepID=UPI0003839385|nr:ATP-binding protein [Rhizobium etli]AGS25791.1 ATP-binding domain-containing protein [Rhizobium etli bv. mimosae str. Mim1]